MKKRSKPEGKQGKGKAAPEKAPSKKGSAGKAVLAKASRLLKGKAKAKKSPPPEDFEVYGEAEAPPMAKMDYAQDRSRQKTKKFRELTWAQFDTLVQGMSREIGQGFAPEVVVGVAHGGVFVGGAMSRALTSEFFPVRISRRSRDKAPELKSVPRIYGEMPAELKDRKVLIVDDVAASGDTLELAKALARKVGAKDVATACLVAREEGYKPDWAALETDELVVFPWDYDLQNDPRFRSS